MSTPTQYSRSVDHIASDECGTHKILTSKTDEFVVGFIGEKISREKL